MTIPVRTKAPVGQFVSTSELCAHLRVDDNDEDDLIAALEKSAVAMLDGYRGLLGRCIQEQEWSVTYGEAGAFRLPLPDVFEVSARDGDGEPVAAGLTQDALGSIVTIAAPATVTMKAKLPEDAVDTAKVAVKLLVGHLFDNREAVVTGTIATALPLSVEAMIDTIRRAHL